MTNQHEDESEVEYEDNDMQEQAENIVSNSAVSDDKNENTNESGKETEMTKNGTHVKMIMWYNHYKGQPRNKWTIVDVQSTYMQQQMRTMTSYGLKKT